MHLFFRSFIHLCICSFVRSFIYPFVLSFVHSFIHLFFRSSIHLSICSFVRPFIYHFVLSFVHSSIHSHLNFCRSLQLNVRCNSLWKIVPFEFCNFLLLVSQFQIRLVLCQMQVTYSCAILNDFSTVRYQCTVYFDLMG